MAGETVLVVDNREDSIKFLRTYVLEPNGYKMLEATDGADALKIALSKKVDLIISDLVMPRMGGLELLEALNHRGIDTPTILMTFHGSEGTAVRAFRLGARDYIIKPFAIDEMLTAIDKALTEARLRQERDTLTQTVLKVNQQLESRMQELRFLYGIGRSVTSLRDIEQILNRIVDAAAFLTEAEEGSIMLIDEESGDLYLRAARGLNERKASSFRIKMHDSIAGQVVKSGQPISIGGQNEDDSFKVKTGYFVKSLLNVPIKNKDEIIGVLAVNNKDTAKAFTDRHLNLLTALADYASVAIDNARMYAQLTADIEQAKKTGRRLEHLVEARTSELENAHLQLSKTENLAILGHMAAGVVNELNSPLNNVLDNLHQLENSIEPSPKNLQLISAIERDTLHCQQTVDSLLDFSNTKNYQFQKVDLNEIIESAWSRYANEHAETGYLVEFVRGFDPQLPLISADEKQLKQALFYLMRHAYLAMPTGGTLRITTRVVGAQVHIIMSDTGEGLSKEDLSHIFDPFYDNGHRAFGLDLSITQAIIERHGGSIEVESEQDQGTTFAIHLPK
ncbi:MAG: response regulator [Anaerolineaceae bacterium]|nr:response regulator [Anaerolineaceae bacterium]MCB9099354.1 response regulator [Anaerolineales bacterium]